MTNWRHRLHAASHVSCVDAGFGMVHADTLVATTADELIALADGAQVELVVDGKSTSDRIAELHLQPGSSSIGATHWRTRRIRSAATSGRTKFSTYIQHRVPCENLIAAYETAAGVRIGR